ncbi:hypothetical protein BD779DRAFT_507132 [Infundibulicybe gibba]|nr:hypothetical protein BD779DRAFT_507132 [Infundibulicybe gibba]
MSFTDPEAVKRKETILRRVEKVLDESDPNVLPRMYREMNRTQMYRDGLRQGKVLMEDEITHQYEARRARTHKWVPAGSPHLVIYSYAQVAGLPRTTSLLAPSRRTGENYWDILSDRTWTWRLPPRSGNNGDFRYSVRRIYSPLTDLDIHQVLARHLISDLFSQSSAPCIYLCRSPQRRTDIRKS